MSKKNVYLCQRNRFGTSWTCKGGFSSYEEADEEFKKQNSGDCSILSTMIGVPSYLPTFIANRYVEWEIKNLQKVEFEDSSIDYQNMY